MHMNLAAPLSVTAVLLALAGCASQVPSATLSESQASDNLVICGQEAGTGTRISSTRCRRVADIETRRKADREAAEALPTELPSNNGR
jgi:hypothetical protein